MVPTLSTSTMIILLTVSMYVHQLKTDVVDVVEEEEELVMLGSRFSLLLVIDDQGR